MKKKDYIIYFYVVYCVFTVIQNLFEMKTVGTSELAIVGGGILVSWIIFLINDVTTEIYGKKVNTKMFVLAGVINLTIVLLSQLLISLPGTYEEQNNAFRLVFSNGVRTTIASLVAFYLGNYINMTIMLILKELNGESNIALFFRAVLSTVVGQLIDNSVFVVLAFAPLGISAFEMNWIDIVTSVAIGTSIETLVESIFVPIITIPMTNKLKLLKDN